MREIMREIGCLNALYRDRRIFYCGTTDELPAGVRELYETVWNECDDWPEYVVTLDEKPYVAFSIVVDNTYIQHLTGSCTASKERIDVAAIEVCKATAQFLLEKLPCGQVFYGEDIDPSGDEALVCVSKDMVEKHWQEILKIAEDNFYTEFERRMAQAIKNL